VCQRLTTDAIAVGRRLVWFQCPECRTVWRGSKTDGTKGAEQPDPTQTPAVNGSEQ
jgi:hypothetical protein